MAWLTSSAELDANMDDIGASVGVFSPLNGRGRDSLAGQRPGELFEEDDESSRGNVGRQSKRRLTASPGQIASLSFLNSSDGSDSGKSSSPAAQQQPAAQIDIINSLSAAPAIPGVMPSQSPNGDFLGLDGSDVGFGRASLMMKNRRESILSPGMAALFGAPESNKKHRTEDDGDKENSGMEVLFTGKAAVGAASSAAGLGAAAAPRSDSFGSADSQHSKVAGLSALNSSAINASSARGPAHRVKTPGRSCLTGRAKEGHTGGILGTAASRRAEGLPAGRRTVIFGSPQAAEYQTDAAPAQSIKAMEKSAAKARFKLGSEPELPFPSLSDAVVSGDGSSAAGAGAAAADDDNSSVESLETANNSAMLKDFEADMNTMESSYVRNKRTRAQSKKTRSSRSSENGTDEDEEGGDDAGEDAAAALAGAAAISTTSSKRSRRSSMGRRTASMDMAVAPMAEEDEAAAEAAAEAAEGGAPGPDPTVQLPTSLAAMMALEMEGASGGSSSSSDAKSNASGADMSLGQSSISSSSAAAPQAGGVGDDMDTDESSPNSANAAPVGLPPPTPMRRSSSRKAALESGFASPAAHSTNSSYASTASAAAAGNTTPVRGGHNGSVAMAMSSPAPAAQGLSMSQLQMTNANVRRSPRLAAAGSAAQAPSSIEHMMLPSAAASSSSAGGVPEPSPITGPAPTLLSSGIAPMGTLTTTTLGAGASASSSSSAAEADALASVAAVKVAPVVTSLSPGFAVGSKKAGAQGKANGGGKVPGSGIAAAFSKRRTTMAIVPGKAFGIGAAFASGTAGAAAKQKTSAVAPIAEEASAGNASTGLAAMSVDESSSASSSAPSAAAQQEMQQQHAAVMMPVQATPMVAAAGQHKYQYQQHDTSVAPGDRTADTVQREAFFAMLNDSTASSMMITNSSAKLGGAEYPAASPVPFAAPTPAPVMQQVQPSAAVVAAGVIGGVNRKQGNNNATNKANKFDANTSAVYDAENVAPRSAAVLGAAGMPILDSPGDAGGSAPGDITSYLGIGGAPIPFPAAAAAASSLNGNGGVLAAGGFGLQAMLLNGSSSSLAAVDASGAGAGAASSEPTTELPSSLAAMMASERLPHAQQASWPAHVRLANAVANGDATVQLPTTLASMMALEGMAGPGRTGDRRAAGSAPAASSLEFAMGGLTYNGIAAVFGAEMTDSSTRGLNASDYTFASTAAVPRGQEEASSPMPASPEASMVGGLPAHLAAHVRMGHDGSLYDIHASTGAADVDDVPTQPASQANQQVRNPAATSGGAPSPAILGHSDSMGMDLDDSDAAAHSKDSVETSSVVEREAQFWESAGLTPSRKSMQEVTRSAAKAARDSSSATSAAATSGAAVAPGTPRSSAATSLQDRIAALQQPRAMTPATASTPSRAPGVVSVQITNANLGTPGRHLGLAGPSSARTAPAPAASAAGSDPDGAFGFEQFCAAAGVLFGLDASDFSSSQSNSSNGAGSASSSSSGMDVSSGSAAAMAPAAGNGNKSKDRRRSSIAMMARKSMAGRRGDDQDANGPNSVAAIASTLVTQHVLLPEREQILGATAILRSEIAKVAAVLSSYKAGLDANPGPAIKSVARAQSIVSANALSGGADCGYSSDEVAQAEELISKLQELKKTHEMNARVTYMQWRTEMAKQRVASMAAGHASLTGQLQELKAADEKLAAMLQHVTGLRNAMASVREAGEAMAAVVEPLKTAIAAEREANDLVKGLSSTVAPLEVQLATLTARKDALAARVEAEKRAIAALDADSAAFEAASASTAVEVVGNAAAGAALTMTATERFTNAAAAAATKYESMVSSSGWSITSMVAGLGSGASAASSSVEMTYAHPDGSSHVLKVSLPTSSSSASASVPSAPVFHSLAFTPSAASSSAALPSLWKAGSGIAEFYCWAVQAAGASFAAEAQHPGADVKSCLRTLTSSMRRVQCLCAEVASLRTMYPIRFSSATGGKWSVCADLGSTALGVKFRLVFDVSAAAVAASYPSTPMQASIVWIGGDKTHAAGILHAVQTSQSLFAAAKAATASSGMIDAVLKAAAAALQQ